MDWLNIDFVKCDKTENKSLVVTLEPHWSPAVSQEVYDVKLPSHCPNLNEIIFKKYHYDGVIVEPSSGAFVFRKNAYIKTLYLDLETLFSANTIAFDLPSNEDIIMHYQTDVILSSPIEHKEFHLNYNQWLTVSALQSFITIVWHLYHNNDPTLNAIIAKPYNPLSPDVKDIVIVWHLYHNNDPTLNTIIAKPYNPLSPDVKDIVKVQSEILSNFSEEEIKAMDMETNPLYSPIAMEFINNHFESFIQLIHLTNNKETLNRMLTDERSARELSGEAKAIIIKRMAELDEERSFEL